MLLFLLLFITQPQTDHTETVRAAKTLVILAGIDPDSSECARWEVTRRVAKSLESEGAGLIAKGGNNCQGYAVDAIMYKDGTVVDILGAGPEGPNSPHWMIQPQKRPPSDWRAPVTIPDPVPAPQPVLPDTPAPPPASEGLAQILSKLDQILFRLDQLEQLDRSDTEKIQQQIDQAIKNAERSGGWLLKVLGIK